MPLLLPRNSSLKYISSIPLVAALLTTACGGTHFSGSNGQRPATNVPLAGAGPGTIETQVSVGCSATATVAPDQAITDGAGTTTTITGTFCEQPQAAKSEALTVLFIFDFSGSMQANDPIKSGSCGRLQAAQAILTKLATAPAKDQENLHLAMQAFGTQQMPGIALTKLPEFTSQLNTQAVCREDGIATNYETAFTAATTLLAPIPGRKVVYFISDGLPTVSGTAIPQGGQGGQAATIAALINNPQSALASYSSGKTAAAKLRAIEGLDLNVVFLGTAGSGNAVGAVPAGTPDPQTYLTEIAGGADHLRVVSNAQDLARQIGTFATPTAASGEFATSSVQGTISAEGFNSQILTVDSVSKDPTLPNTWHFSMAPATLLGAKGRAVANIIKIDVTGIDGKPHSVTSTIQFTAK